MTPSAAYDTIALTVRGGRLSCNLTNRSTSLSESNSDHSTKGIKVGNEILINGGSLNIKSYDDSIHANKGSVLENGSYPTGAITVNGANVSIYSNGNGLHADGSLVVNSGNLNILNSYVALEGETVGIYGGKLSLFSQDDGISATLSSGTTITIGGGENYIFAGSDGLDSTSRTANVGITVSGGKSLILSKSHGSTAIDCEQGYSYTNGTLVSIMADSESDSIPTCNSFASVGKRVDVALTKGDFLVCTVGVNKLTMNMAFDLPATIIMLGSNTSSAASPASSSHKLGEGEFIWE
jgi:hypothetical protein